ncbi:MAG: hypothetical protein EOO61_10310 [Hymenobacter sp.]|nr:MAG: hypothetical protein EOO61_10310 [Hymenobacter sp.]
MKTRRLLYLLLLGCLTTQCATSPELAPTPTYDELSTLLLKELAPQVVRQWTLAEVRYTRWQFLGCC